MKNVIFSRNSGSIWLMNASMNASKNFYFKSKFQVYLLKSWAYPKFEIKAIENLSKIDKNFKL
jgi:hypothetical protein